MLSVCLLACSSVVWEKCENTQKKPHKRTMVVKMKTLRTRLNPMFISARTHTDEINAILPQWQRCYTAVNRSAFLVRKVQTHGPPTHNSRIPNTKHQRTEWTSTRARESCYARDPVSEPSTTLTALFSSGPIRAFIVD